MIPLVGPTASGMLHGLARVCEAAARFHANDKEALRLIDSPDGAVEGCYTEDEDEGEDTRAFQPDSTADVSSMQG